MTPKIITRQRVVELLTTDVALPLLLPTGSCPDCGLAHPESHYTWFHRVTGTDNYFCAIHQLYWTNVEQVIAPELPLSELVRT